MLKKFLVSLGILFCCFAQTVIAQNKQDYIWLFGHDSDGSLPGKESYIFDFNSNNYPSAFANTIPISFRGENNSICDKDGNLLFYTNGCHVVGADHEIMPNGFGLNEGQFVEVFMDTCNGYRAIQNMITIPDPGNQDGYYIIHKSFELTDSLDIDKMKYTYVDLSKNGGKGDVTMKNEVFVEYSKILGAYLNAIPHANQKDWWIINPVHRENKYLRILLDETGLNVLEPQDIGPRFHWNASTSGTSVFSPDGKQYAYFNKDDNLLLYNFNRETGWLSNLRQLTLKENTPTIGFFSSVEFSSNSRFLYVAVQDSLWQIDTWETELEQGTELIDSWNGVNDPFQTHFTLLKLAPDCKIYMCSGSGTNTYHVINRPNEKGKACDFVQQGIQLPFVSSVRNMPHFPRFRVDDIEKCDPTISSVFGNDVYYRRDLHAYPNPISDWLSIDIPSNRKGRLFLFDITGQLVWEDNVIQSTSKRVNLAFLNAGLYNLEFIPDDKSDRLIWTKQIVKE